MGVPWGEVVRSTAAPVRLVPILPVPTTLGALGRHRGGSGPGHHHGGPPPGAPWRGPRGWGPGPRWNDPTVVVLPAEVVQIRQGDLGTQDTLERMGRLAVAAAHDPEFIDHAHALVADLPPKAYMEEARRIFDHVKATVRYVHDPAGLEMTTDPRTLLFVSGQGDCDDASCVIAALGMALGMGAAFRTVSTECEITNGVRECPWRHVYAVLGVPRGSQVDWVPADTAEGSRLGWEPKGPSISRVRTWVVSNPS